ncbi:hypothetical protein AVEN_154135-1 [Araneus ventricosus]|uniref:Uncharacterized protein n=1 Tax=Araneus ventricosus TaxID=182803 RepID=A0A4Y2MT45_ARAVE|nr:hypothetical protein AVEN_154135-1 [Araneus ventricosus]
MPQAHTEPLTYLELYSGRKALVNIPWRHPSAHSWYRSDGPGGAIRFKGVRKDHRALARLSSGHLKTLRFSRGDKKFNICTRCNMTEATPQHLLDCVALVYDDLFKRPDFVLKVMRANDLMDLIRFRSEGLEKKKKSEVETEMCHQLLKKMKFKYIFPKISQCSSIKEIQISVREKLARQHLSAKPKLMKKIYITL